MHNYFTLTTTGDDRAEWIALIDRAASPLKDIHFHPDYLRIYELTYGEKALLFCIKLGPYVIFQPFLMRQTSLSLSKDSYRDLTSAYGYGGPLQSKNVPQEAQQRLRDAYQECFQHWSSSEGIVSEFCLLNPVCGEEQKKCLPQDLHYHKRKTVVVADLRPSMPQIWARIEERQRKGVALARRKGIKIHHSSMCDKDMAAFQTSYISTMERVEARPSWHFPDSYFVNCRDCLGPKNASLFNALWEGKIIASFFTIQMYDTFYYHFACSNPEYRKLNPTSLLLLDTMMWAKQQGYSHYHMGGGRTAGKDSLFQFKHSFCKTEVPIYSYSKVLNQPIYEQLVSTKMALEITEDGEPMPEDYFPRYRAR